jgi:hypothetical protein
MILKTSFRNIDSSFSRKNPSPFTLLSSLFFLFSLAFTNAQTIEGTTGLFFIPTAEMQTDKQVTFGVIYEDKSLISFSDYQRNAITPYFNFTFLPFVEISGKITRLINSNNQVEGIGDRTISMRIRLYEEGEDIPSILFGIHDLGAVYGGDEAIRNNALYLVCSKHFDLDSKIFNQISLHAGFGSDLLNAQHHNFVGLFGGIDLKIYKAIEFITEYDGLHSNTGLRLKLFDHISLLGGFLQYKYFSGGAAVNFQL